MKTFHLFEKPFCLVHAKGESRVYFGDIHNYGLIEQIPGSTRPGVNTISLLPYCQIKERGYETHDDGEKIISLTVNEVVPIEDYHELKANAPQISLDGEVRSNMTDDEYREVVRNIKEHEIFCGEGSNFLLSRKFFGQIGNYEQKQLLDLYVRLINNEFESYWTFIFYDGERAFLGASPERHLTMDAERTSMNPICGTLPKRDGRTFPERLKKFVVNQKEINELFQVVDEELKTICKLCPVGGKVLGPHLKEMGALIHTEYYLEGKGDVADVRRALRESLYAATMVGSPLENAARIIKKYENSSRRYYSSVLCMIGNDSNGVEYLDSAITIRTMEIEPEGRFTIQCGASIVRDSEPDLEVEEINAKGKGLLNAIFGTESKEQFLNSQIVDSVAEDFYRRNTFLSRFWMEKNEKDICRSNGRKVVLIDNEDDFIYMVNHMLVELGYRTEVVRYDKFRYAQDCDLVIVGPGPGDPCDTANPKMQMNHKIIDELVKNNQKTIGICLGNQLILKYFGYSLTRAEKALQGVQKEVEFFGRKEKVGFYNSYFALDNGVGELEVQSDERGYIIGAKGENIVTYQFHVESILTQNSLGILKNSLEYLGV